MNGDYAEAFNNRGIALQALTRYEEALAHYDQAIALRPDQADAYSNRGDALKELGRYEEALASCEKAIDLNPAYVEPFNNRGNALLELKRYVEALATFDQAIALKPDYPEAFNNRGIALKELRRYAEAVASYDQAIVLKPDYAEAFNNRGDSLLQLKRYQQALASYEEAIALQPGLAIAASSRFLVSAQICDWNNRSRHCHGVIARCESGQATLPFAMLSAIDSPEHHRRAAQLWVREQYPGRGKMRARAVAQPHARLRIAYVSADFRVHATAYLMSELFTRHDRNKFEIFAFSLGPSDGSATRKSLEKAFDRFIDVSNRSDREIAELMLSLEIDIAVDLKGFTEFSRTGIFAQRPAPIQVNYLGYPGTMGADYIDYIIADAYLVPDDAQQHYCEQVVILPDSYQVNDSQGGILPAGLGRKDLGLPEHGFVFCCFNNNYKITPDVFAVWMGLLHKVPGSVLWLLADNEVAARNLTLEARSRGMTPERLVFAPRIDRAQHLSRMRLADLFLDTLPCNAHSTASDALRAGVPVLTCSGRSFAARVGGSLLCAIGIPELITHSIGEYEALALKLAREPSTLSDIAARLRANRATYPLFATDRFRRHIEAAYLTMWERHERGLPPASFTVQPK